MPYYDKDGKSVDTSEYWRMPSYQAQHAIDQLKYNKRKNHYTEPPQNAGVNYRADRPFQGYHGGRPYYGTRGFNSDTAIDAVQDRIAKLWPLTLWLVTRLGLHIVTLAAYIATIGFMALTGDLYFSNGLLILITSGIVACLLMGGLAGMVRQINREAKIKAAQQTIASILGAGLQGWIKSAVFGASLPIIVVAGLYANRLASNPDLFEDIIWFAAPLCLALCQVSLTTLVRRRWAISLCALCLLSAGTLFIFGG